MSDQQAITIRLNSTKAKNIESLANEYKRSMNYIINEAIEFYLDRELLHLQELNNSMQQANDGKIVSHDEAKSRIKMLFDEIG